MSNVSIKTEGVALYVFVLVLNMIFPVLSYTFTTFGTQWETFDIDLNPDSLMMIGLNLVDGESHNITWEGDFVEYTDINLTIRLRWATWERLTLPDEDGIRFQKRSAVGQAFDSWAFPFVVSVKSITTNEWFTDARNDTIIRDFDPKYNWTRFVLYDGHHVFITPFETHGNMTRAVHEDGTLNVTIAQSFDETEDRFNFWSFIKWYSSLLIGSNSWGLPSVFAWIIRVFAAISFLAAILLVKELTRV